MLLSSTQDALSVAELEDSLEMDRAAVVADLKILRHYKLIVLADKKFKKYRIGEKKVWMPRLLNLLSSFPNSEKTFAGDLKRFAKLLPKVIESNETLRRKKIIKILNNRKI